jgi:hypothetical protein
LKALDGGGEAVAFLERLVACGRSSYTLRTYAGGLDHFVRWLRARDLDVGNVDRGVVVDYVADFARGERDGVAVGRAPATVNHRVSVLASFFAWLVEPDREAATGGSRSAGVLSLLAPRWRGPWDAGGRGAKARAARRVASPGAAAAAGARGAGGGACSAGGGAIGARPGAADVVVAHWTADRRLV